MSLFFAIILMISMGLLGGITNWALAKTASPTAKPHFWHGLWIGLGATILVPLFLELAQSKLLDNIRPEWTLTEKLSLASGPLSKTKANPADTATIKPDAIIQATAPAESKQLNPPIKTYLLFAAYCFLAAVAGPRFINSLIEGVLKEKEIARLNEQNDQIAEEKEQVERKAEKQNTINSIMAKDEEAQALSAVDGAEAIQTPINSKIGPVLYPEDPQKARFGGQRERNYRKLCAKVQPAQTQGLFRLDLWVESTDEEHPLITDVVFYLHNTFRPSVFTLKTTDFRGGKAEVEPKNTWGAFTVGAVTDNGKTLLEYDLSQEQDFPTDFRLK